MEWNGKIANVVKLYEQKFWIASQSFSRGPCSTFPERKDLVVVCSRIEGFGLTVRVVIEASLYAISRKPTEMYLQ